MRITRPAAAPSRRVLLGGLVLAPLALAACTAPAEDPAGDPAAEVVDLLRAHDLDGLDARSIIDRLEALPRTDRPADLMASVRPGTLELSDTAGRTAVLPLPEDETYVSIAPFVTTTHDCFFHSLTTCLGELQEQAVHVRIAPSTATVGTGAEALIDEARTTAPNGFLGLWLPRGEELTLELAMDDLRATTPLSTTAEAPTCLTTVQLEA